MQYWFLRVHSFLLHVILGSRYPQGYMYLVDLGLRLRDQVHKCVTGHDCISIWFVLPADTLVDRIPDYIGSHGTKGSYPTRCMTLST